jgi:hypothetical protein
MILAKCTPLCHYFYVGKNAFRSLLSVYSVICNARLRGSKGTVNVFLLGKFMTVVDSLHQYYIKHRPLREVHLRLP